MTTPWIWTSSNAGPEDEYGCTTRGPIDLATFESSGYIGNPELYAGDDCVLSAGCGEYSPIHGETREIRAARGRLIAKAPDMLALLKLAVENDGGADTEQDAHACCGMKRDSVRVVNGVPEWYLLPHDPTCWVPQVKALIAEIEGG